MLIVVVLVLRVLRVLTELRTKEKNTSIVVDRARFDVASRLLTESEAPSIQVAYATAYSDPSHFSRAFRRIAGVSPREYRQQARRLSAE